MTASIALQCLLGMQCNDFVIIAGDQTNTMSIIVLKNDEQKLHNISDSHVMGIIGDSGDTAQFVQFISKNLQLYRMKNGYELNTAATAHFVRKNVVDNLKGLAPPMLNMLVGGCDEGIGGQLYTMDFLGSSLRVPFGVHGFGGLISMCVLEQHYKPTLTEPEAYEIIKKGVREIHHRLFVSLPNFQVKVINKNGIKTLPIITPASFMQK